MKVPPGGTTYESSLSRSLCISVGTVLAFLVFFGFRAFKLFFRVLGRAFSPNLLWEKSLFKLLGRNSYHILGHDVVRHLSSE